jgi:signal transduction histidine kinase
VNDILHFAKIESGTLSMRVTSGCPCEIAHAALSLVEPLARTQGLACQVQLPEHGLPPLKADPDRVRQILVNLLSNAVKFTPAGAITVRGCVSQAEWAKEPTVSIEVRDTGIGLSP